jgi:hypothetical protein
MSRRSAIAAVFLFVISSITGVAAAAELVMVEQANCHWCHKWDAEVGTTYDQTPVGRIAPLRRVDLADPKPADLDHINLGRASPVFILMEDGAEIGRVRGYPGKAMFWTLLREQLVKLPSLQRQAPAGPEKTALRSSD